MDVKQAILKLVKDNNLSQQSLAVKCGFKSPGTMSNITKRNDTRVSMLFKICEAVDYDIILKPRHGEDKSERTIVFTEMNVKEETRGKR